MKKISTNYVNGRELHNALVEWYKTDDRNNIPPIIVSAIDQICKRLATKNNFRGYSFIEEMIGSALLASVIALQERKYDPKKGDNPFAYFTQIAYNEFIRVITEEKKQSYLKHKALEQHVIDSMLVGETIEIPEDQGGKIAELVEKFEK